MLSESFWRSSATTSAAAFGRFRRGLHEPRDLGDRLAGVRLRLGRDIACGPLQRVADLLLPARGARARLFPLLAQGCGHRTERLGPCRQALLVARCQFRLQVRVRLADGAQQRRRVLLEGRRGRRQRLLVVAPPASR